MAKKQAQGAGKTAAKASAPAEPKMKKDVNSVKVRHILCEKHSKSMEAIAQLQEGISFDKVAQTFSEDKAKAGGSLGWMVRASMVGPFQDAAFSLTPSTVELEQLVQALSTIYDSTASAEERRLANSLCESVKEHKEAPLWGHYLASKRNAKPDYLRHFGLSLIESSIAYKWNDGSYGDEERSQLKDTVLDLVQNGTGDMFEEPVFIKEKVARLFVEVAKRMWPLGWTDMDFILRRMYDENPTRREYVLLIYRSLVEDVFIFEDAVAELRKAELVTGIMAVTLSAPALERLYAERGTDVNLTSLGSSSSDFEILLKMMRADPENEGWLLRWTKAAEELHREWGLQIQRRDVNAFTTERLAVLTLNALSVQLDWIPWRALQDSHVVYLLLSLIPSKSPSIRDASVDGLLVILSRHVPPSAVESTVPYLWQPLFAERKLEGLLGAWASVQIIDQAAAFDDEEYRFLKRLTQAVVAFGEVHIVGKKITTTPPNFSMYLGFLLLISDHPSLLVSSASAPLWFELLKHDHFKQTSELHAALPRLLEIMSGRICKTGNSVSEAAESYNSADFDDDDQLEQTASELRPRLLQIVRSVASIEPDASFNWISTRIQAMISTPPPLTELSESGFLDSKSPFVHLFDGNCELQGLVIKGSQSALHAKNGNPTALINGMMELVDAILNYQTLDPVLVRIQLRMVTMFAEVLSASPPLILRCVQKMYEFVTFAMPDEKDFIEKHESVREETRLLRRTACSSLVRLAVAMPDVLIDLYGEICPAIQTLIADRKVVRMEQTLLIEFLLSIVYFSRAPIEEQKEAFTALLSPTLRELDVIASVSAASAENLIEFSGLPLLLEHAQVLRATAVSISSQRDLLTRLESFRSERSQMLGTLGAILAFTKRTVDIKAPSSNTKAALLWGEFAPQIAACLFAVVKSVHGIWNPARYPSAPPEFAILAHGTGKDITAHTRQSASDIREERANNELFNQIVQVTVWTSNMRDNCLQALSLMTYLGPHLYEPPSIANMWITILLQPEAEMDNRHWKTAFATTLRPLVLNCPADIYASFLRPVLSTTFGTMSAKLDQQWNELVERGVRLSQLDDDERVAANDEGAGGLDNDFADDILAERSLRYLTRAYADFFMSLFAIAPQAPQKKDKEEKTSIIRDGRVAGFAHPTLVEFLLWDQEIAQILLTTLSQLVIVKDTSASRKAIKTCVKLLPTLLTHPEFHAWLGSVLLKTYLEALHDSYHIDVHTELFAAIAELYKQLRPLSEAPYQIFASLPGVTSEQLNDFESKLAAAPALKMQSALTRELLQKITALSVSQLGKKQQSFILNMNEKNLVDRPRRRAEETGEGDAANEWFGELFEQ
ncbi:hypothetical protein HDU88_001558 [Geranomyces variabilis]|nr:hypothetical protein HDU88_001558 [Geranomyces variabilis]